MQLHPALVRFVDPRLKWIPHRRGRLALLAREILRPWLDRRRVKRIARGAHLEDDAVEMVLLCRIKQRDHLFLLIFNVECALARPNAVAHRRYPHRPHFSRGIGNLRFRRSQVHKSLLRGRVEHELLISERMETSGRRKVLRIASRKCSPEKRGDGRANYIISAKIAESMGSAWVGSLCSRPHRLASV